MTDKRNTLPLRVLYVEDEAIIREEMASFLRRRVEGLVLAVDGRDGLEKYTALRPDVVVTDIKMPGLTGLELAEAIRALDPLCPILVTTAVSDMETLFESIRVGIDRYLVKPIQIQDLTEALEKASEKLQRLKAYGVAGDAPRWSEPERRGLEQRAEAETARLVKQVTGKGPKSVRAFVQGELLTLQLHETRTPYERALLGGGENQRLVDFARETFYQTLGGELSSRLRDIFRCQVRLESARADSVMDLDELQWTLTLR